MGQGDEQHPVGSRERGAERQHRVGGGAGQQTPGLVGPEAPGQLGGGQQPGQAQAGHGQRVPGRGAQRGQHGRQDLVDVPGERGEEAAVGPGIGAQGGRGVVHRAPDGAGAPAVERVGESHGRRQQLDPSGRQVDALEERRRQHQRVDGRAHVVQEARQGQLLGAAATAR